MLICQIHMLTGSLHSLRIAPAIPHQPACLVDHHARLHRGKMAASQNRAPCFCCEILRIGELHSKSLRMAHDLRSQRRDLRISQHGQ